MAPTRIEHDLLGEREVPAERYGRVIQEAGQVAGIQRVR